MIKKLLQAAALLAVCSGAAQATTYDFSYTFTDNNVGSPVVTGSFDATLSGNLFTDVSDLSVSVNGVAFNGPLSLGALDFSSGLVNFAPGAAVISTNGSQNNFVIVDTNVPDLSSNWTNLFYYVNGAPGTTPSGGSQEASLQNIAGPSDTDVDVVGTWTVKPVPVPAALPLLFSGLGLLAAAKRRRREAATA